MQIRRDATASVERFTARLRPAQGFSEAAASIQAALDELRRAESALESQIADLRSYRRDGAARTRAAA